MKCTANVMNCPKELNRYVVARIFDGEFWFWGSWKNEKDAKKVAVYIGGCVIENEEAKDE